MRRMLPIVAAGALVLATPRDVAAPPLGPLSVAALRGHMRFLADDALEGRGTATRGYAVAARYVAAQLEAAGLEPAGEAGGFEQQVPLLRMQVGESGCAIDRVGPGGIRSLRYGVDYVMGGDPVRDAGAVSAPAVFAGFGITAPGMGHDDYAGLDVRGKVVAILTGAPARFPHNERAFYSYSPQKERNAADHGAVGVLVLRTPRDEERAPWARVARQARLPGMRWTDSTGAAHDAVPALHATATLSRSGAERLFAGARRPLATVLAEADTGAPKGFALPARIRARRLTRRSRVASPNVVGLLRGADPRLRDQLVVVSAHLDHLGIGRPMLGDSIHNGAYDNASGVALMLELARAFAERGPRPRRSVVFLAVTAEEKGLQGSDYFARFPTVPRAGIVANLNLDMFLMLQPLRSVVLFGAEHSSLGPLAEAAARSMGLRVAADPAPEEVVFIRSDQFSFVRQGVPALFPVAGPGERSDEVEALARWRRITYHSPSDDMSQSMHLESATRFGELAYRIVRRVADDPEPPRWNPRDFFGERFGHGGSAR